jgi:hypothetical protein
MQNVQVLLQPTLTDTQAEYGDSRRVGSVDGVPKTTSTQGAFLVMPALSFWARQPPTAICIPGFLAFTGARWPRLPYSLLSAFSRTAQVLKTTTSACSPSGART